MTEQQTPRSEAGFFTTIRGWGLTRSDARVISGVGGGLAERLGWSRAWMRIAIVGAAIILNGIVLLAYAAAWALLPDRQGRIVAQDFGRGVPNVGALIGIGVLGLLGLVRLGEGPFSVGPRPWVINGEELWGNGMVGGLPGEVLRLIVILFAILIPLALLAGGIVLAVYLVRRNRDGGTWQPPQSPSGAPQSPAGQAGDDAAPPVYAAPPTWAEERQRMREQAAQYGRTAAAEARRNVDEVMADVRRTTTEAKDAWKEGAPSYVADPWQQRQQSWQGQGQGQGQPWQGQHQAWQGQHQAWQAQAPGRQQAAQPQPAAPPAARSQRPPRVPGPGKAFWLLTLAWALFAGAGVAWADWQDRLVVNPAVAWFALFLTGLGVILVLVSLSGRRSGFLAFCSALLVLPALVVIAESDSIRNDWVDRYLPEIEFYTDADGVRRIDIGDGEVVIGADPAPEPSPDAIDEVDAVQEFDQDYSLIMLPAGCYASDSAPEPAGLSRGFVDHADLTESTSETVTAGYTTVRVPAGASVEIATDSGTAGTVYWPARDVWCDLSFDDGVVLANADAPTLTLDLSNPNYGTAIVVLEEVAR